MCFGSIGVGVNGEEMQMYFNTFQCMKWNCKQQTENCVSESANTGIETHWIPKTNKRHLERPVNRKLDKPSVPPFSTVSKRSSIPKLGDSHGYKHTHQFKEYLSNILVATHRNYDMINNGSIHCDLAKFRNTNVHIITHNWP